MAAPAAEIAAVTANRHDPGAGTVMAYRLSLDRSDINGGNNAIRQVIQGSVAIDVCLAETALPVHELAAPES